MSLRKKTGLSVIYKKIVMNILLTGGAGYIGSHTIIELDKAGHSVVVVGYSVLDVVKAFEKVNGLKVPYVIKDCRPSDGKRSLISKICVAIAGIFRRIILTGTRSNYATG